MPWLLKRITGFNEPASVPEIKTKPFVESAMQVELVLTTFHNRMIESHWFRPVEVLLKFTTNGAQPVNGVAVNDGVGGERIQTDLVIESFPQTLPPI